MYGNLNYKNVKYYIIFTELLWSKGVELEDSLTVRCYIMVKRKLQ